MRDYTWKVENEEKAIAFHPPKAVQAKRRSDNTKAKNRAANKKARKQRKMK